MTMPVRVRPEELEALIGRIPYARFLGLKPELKGDELTVVLPFQEKLVGNPMLPALHGGVIGALMELTAVAQIYVAQGAQKLPKTIDISIDYLRSGRPVDTFARAHVTKLGRRIANVRVEAWQHERADPIAALHGHFLVSAPDRDER
jgi:uncharacterized protein (TIGR00369 family)